MSLTASSVFRDYVTDGVPASGVNPPAKAEIRTLLGAYEEGIDGIKVSTFSTLTEAIAANIKVGADVVRTLGRNSIGDNGAATYIRIGASTAAAWRFQSLDGQWWALSDRVVTPEMFGAVTGQDCTSVFIAMADWLNNWTGGGGIVVNFLPNADYSIWPVGTHPGYLMRLTSLDGVTFNFNGGRISTPNAFGFNDSPIVFYLEHCSDIVFNGPSYAATAWSGSLHSTDFGEFISVYETAAPWSENIRVYDAKQNGGSGFFRVSCLDPALNGGGFAQNFTVINADIQNVFYGLVFQASGDNFFARGIKGTNNGRIYFPWNVSNHDVEIISDGSTAGFVNVHLKAYALPWAGELRRSLSNIRVKYRDSASATVTGFHAGLFLQQYMPEVVVTGAANNGSGLVRLTVTASNTTAHMATGQTWFVNGLGGNPGSVNLLQWKITVVDSTHVDLQGSTFSGSYTSGGYMRVPATLKNIHVELDVTGNSAVTESPVFVTQKNNEDGTVDTTTNGYTIENIAVSGSIKNANSGSPAVSLFANNGTSTGTWTSETIRNVVLRDLTISGPNATAVVDATNVTANMVLENIWSTPGGVLWTLTDPNNKARIRNVSASGISDRLPGTATNDNASAGNIGEYVESVITSGSAVALTTATAKTVTSISLTAGDWDVDGVVGFLPANTTSVTLFAGCLSLVTNTLDVTPGRIVNPPLGTVVYNGGTATHAPVPPYRFSLNATTTVFLVARSDFTASTNVAYGIVRARRVR
ncbi:hypothetical protein ABID59_001431 [Bradyrhizobium sp. S3.3.6]|uniref:hypothetical protein n=1 Tax=Bradyrhizobium sp. S3.3.6 TaxID=3156429 RepID=UPI003392F899